MTSNNRLQMLIRLKIEYSPDSVISVDRLIASLSGGICDPDFFYDALSDMRRDGQITISPSGKDDRIVLLTTQGRANVEFDKKVWDKIAGILNDHFNIVDDGIVEKLDIREHDENGPIATNSLLSE